MASRARGRHGEVSLEPKSIIIVGASSNRARYANRAVRAYRDLGWTVYPVHPREQEVEGLRCYATVADVPGTVSTMSLYLPPEAGLDVLAAAAAKGVREVFVNPGAGSPALVEKIRSLGMVAIEACSILAVGADPQSYAE